MKDDFEELYYLVRYLIWVRYLDIETHACKSEGFCAESTRQDNPVNVINNFIWNFLPVA